MLFARVCSLLVLIGIYVQCQELYNTTSVSFQRDGIPTAESYLRYRGEIPTLTAFSVCFRVNLKHMRDPTSIISYAIEGDANHLYMYLDYAKKKFVVVCCHNNVYTEISVQIYMEEWHSICVIFDFENLFVKGLWDDWQFSMDSSFVNSTGKLELEKGGILIFGQDQDAVGSGFRKTESFCGSISDFKLYDIVLSQNETEDYIYYRGMDIIQDPLIDLRNVNRDFVISQGDIEQILIDGSMEIPSLTRKQIIFPELRSYEESEVICKAVQGKPSYPENDEQNTHFVSLTTPYLDQCGIQDYIDTFWVGIRNKSDSADWISSDGESLTYTNFYESFFLSSQECATLITAQKSDDDLAGKWQMTSCEKDRCVFCEVNIHRVYTLRGLCKKSLFDREYIIKKNISTLGYTGLLYSEMNFIGPSTDSSNEFGSWEITSSLNNKIKATLRKTSPTHYPFGTNSWIIENDRCNGSVVQLKFSRCRDFHFACEDGGCTYREFRCDGEVDCADGSDEIDCDRIYIPQRYDPTQPAPIHKEDGKFKAIEVEAEMSILSIKGFNLSEFYIEIEIQLILRWFDRRLRFLNLHYNPLKNEVPVKVWLPPIDFLGDEDTFSEIEVKSNLVAVQRQSIGTTPPLETLKQDILYEGSENPLLHIQDIIIKSDCTFKLFAFPFDIQNCTVKLEMTYIPKREAVLLAREVAFLGDRTLLQYHLDNVTIHNRTCDSKYVKRSCLIVNLIFSNLSKYFFSSTYLPTFVLMIIGYQTFFFPLDDFSDRFIVSLTGLLVEAAFFMQTSSSIPQTSYIKMIDIWFMFCIVYFSLLMLVLLLINRSLDTPNETSENNETGMPLQIVGPGKCCFRWRSLISPRCKISAYSINCACRILFPLLCFIFMVIYFDYANKLSQHDPILPEANVTETTDDI